MERIVVDASVIVKWYYHERGSDQAIQLLASDEHDIVVPDIAIIEVPNAIRRREREREIDASIVDAALADLDLVLTDRRPSLPLVPQAVEIARRLSHPLADCIYLALAEHLECRLVTADEAFIARSARGGGDLRQRIGSLSEFGHDPS